MARDPRKLEVFELADNLVLELYRCTRAFPSEERYGLQSQLRRAAVSVPTNIVEGCARPTERDYLHFMSMAYASASEVGYLLTIAQRLGYLSEAERTALEDPYDKLSRSLRKLVDRVREQPQAASRKPQAD